jgi:hypothetical protein
MASQLEARLERPMVVIGRPGNARVQTFTAVSGSYFFAVAARWAAFTEGRTNTMPSL